MRSASIAAGFVVALRDLDELNLVSWGARETLHRQLIPQRKAKPVTRVKFVESALEVGDHAPMLRSALLQSDIADSLNVGVGQFERARLDSEVFGSR